MKKNNKNVLMLEKAIRILLEKDIKPRDIMTRKAFENAITMVAVLGGSTKCGYALNRYGSFCRYCDYAQRLSRYQR